MKQTMGHNRYSYHPPHPDHPMLRLGSVAPLPFLGSWQPGQALPVASVDLRDRFLPCRDQGQEGCCSGFSTAAFREFFNGSDRGYLSPAYLYARTRMAEGTFPTDAGATIADEIATLMGFGVCPESLLPYRANPADGPSPETDTAAAVLKIAAGAALSCDPWYIRAALAFGFPVVFGMPVYESFERTAHDGIVSVPNRQAEEMLGGHALLAVGFNDASQMLLVRNSWGPDWGLTGCCFLPYPMIADFFEAWTLSAL